MKRPIFLISFFSMNRDGIEMLDLAGDLAVEQRRIEGFNAGNAAAALQQRFPGLLRGIANRGQQTDAGDYDSAGNNVLL